MKMQNRATYSLQEVIKLFFDEFQMCRTTFYKYHRDNMSFIAVSPRNLRIERQKLFDYIYQMFNVRAEIG